LEAVLDAHAQSGFSFYSNRSSLFKNWLTYVRFRE
jgi:hypothetical protein